jgi:hypothetical protein
MKSLLPLVFLAGIGFSAGAHEHASGGPDFHLTFADVHAHWYWEVPPSLSEEALARVEFRRASDHAPTALNADPQVEVSMPGMNHGAVPTKIEKVTDAAGMEMPGVYRVSHIFLYMEGPWQVNLSLTADDGSVQTQSFEVDMGTGGGMGGMNMGSSHSH